MSNSSISNPRTGSRALLMGLLLCLFGPVSLPAFAQSGGAQATTCHPAAGDYLNLPKLTLKSGHKPDYIPEWRSSAKRVDRYGREVAPLANAAGAVLSASRYSEDLGHSLRTAAINFWRAFDESGQVPEIIQQDYAYFILNVWGHNSSMAGLNRMTGNADAGFITATASVQRPSFWERIPNGAQGEELLKLAVQADYLNYSQCNSGGDSVEKQIERVLLRNQTLGYWHLVPQQLARMELASFTEQEKSRILDAMIQDSRSGRQSHDVSSQSAIRAWLSGGWLERERTNLLARSSSTYWTEFAVRHWLEYSNDMWTTATALGRHDNDGDNYIASLFYQYGEGFLENFDGMRGAAAIDCAIKGSKNAAIHIFEKYPLAFASDEDLGGSWGLSPLSQQYQHYGKPQLIYVGVDYALISCVTGLPFGSDSPHFKELERYNSGYEASLEWWPGAPKGPFEVIELPYKLAHNRAQFYIEGSK